MGVREQALLFAIVKLALGNGLIVTRCDMESLHAGLVNLLINQTV